MAYVTPMWVLKGLSVYFVRKEERISFVYKSTFKMHKIAVGIRSKI